MNRHGTDRRNLLQATVATTLGACALDALSAPIGDVYRWGSSSLGSSGYVIMEAFSQTANRFTPYRNSSLATAGTAENMYLIGEGQLEFGHSTSVDWMTALAGRKPYIKPVRASQLFAYAVWHQLPLVHANARIRHFTELAGHSFSPSLPGSGTAAMYVELSKAANVHDQILWRFGSWSEVYTAFRANQIDSVVGVLTNGIPSSGIQQLEATLDIRALTIAASTLKRARGKNPGIFESVLNSKNWNVVREPILVPQMSGILAAHHEVSPEVAYEVTKSILDRAEEVQKTGAPLNGLTIELASRNLITNAPVNAGAAQYFKEHGVWRNELTVAG